MPLQVLTSRIHTRTRSARLRVAAVLFALIALSGCAHDQRSIGSMVDDAAVELKATGILTTDSRYKGQMHVNVTSVNGIVLLTGEAPTEELRDSLLETVRGIQSIRRIVNEIRIAPPSSLGARMQDSWISSKVKTRLIGTKGVHASRINVMTENRSVFLLGLVSQQEGELAANSAANASGAERIVKLFEYLD
jgi:osmotically-inducible protein OsmY